MTKSQDEIGNWQSEIGNALLGHRPQITIVHVPLIIDAEDLGSNEVTSRHVVRIKRLTSNRHHLQIHGSSGKENAKPNSTGFSTESFIDL